MNAWLTSLAENSVQCWGCLIFDKLFEFVSVMAGGVYGIFSQLCVVLFSALFMIFVINAVLKNARGNMPDPWLKKSVQKVFVSSVIALGLLGVGVEFPRIVTTILFEPVADITLMYSQSMVGTSAQLVQDTISYQPLEISDTGFYRPQLRDTIIAIMQTTIFQFQSYVKLGLAFMDGAFDWSALSGIGSLVKHFIMFMIGFGVAWGFFKLFFKYCFYFMDTIIAMAVFAFLFPISLVMFVFKDAEHVPEFIKKLANTVGKDQIKNLINAIVTLGSVVMVYTMVMIIIARFFSSSDVSYDQLMAAITDGSVYASDLDTINLESVTFTSVLALLYVLNYICAQIPQVTKQILSAFGVSETTKYGDGAAEMVTTYAKNATNLAVDLIKKAKGDTPSDGATKTTDKKTDDATKNKK